MVQAHDRQMESEPFSFFSCTPGSPNQSVHIGPELSAGMIETEKRIKAHFLKFPLSGDGPSFTFEW